MAGYPRLPVKSYVINMGSTNISKTTPTTIDAAVDHDAMWVEVINPDADPLVLYLNDVAIAVAHPIHAGGRIVPCPISKGGSLKALTLGAADISAGVLVLNFFN